MEEVASFYIKWQYLRECRCPLEVLENVLVDCERFFKLTLLFQRSGLIFEIGNRWHRSPVTLWIIFSSFIRYRQQL